MLAHDQIGEATAFAKRLYLQSVRNPAPEQRITLQVKRRSGPSRAVNLVADTMAFDLSDIATYFTWPIADLIFVVVGSIIVLLRPSKMTWAFFLYCIGTAPGIMLGYYWLPAWLVFSSGVFVNSLQALGFAAFLVFCVRVPERSFDRGAWRYVESVGAPVVLVSLLLCGAATDLSILGTLHADAIAGQFQASILSATYVIGLLALTARFFRERGHQRNRVAWIIAGFLIGIGSRVAINLADPGASIYTALSGDGTAWWLTLPLLPALEVAIPLIGRLRSYTSPGSKRRIKPVANRTLVYGLVLMRRVSQRSLCSTCWRRNDLRATNSRLGWTSRSRWRSASHFNSCILAPSV